MDDDEYQQDFEQEDPQQQPQQKKSIAPSISASQNNRIPVHRPRIQSERKFNGANIVRTLRELTRDRKLSSTGSTKVVMHTEDSLHLAQEASEYVQFLTMSEEELKRSNYQLQIRINSVKKGFDEKEAQMEMQEIESQKQTQQSLHTQMSQLTKLPRKRVFNKEQHLRYLQAKSHEYSEQLLKQNNQILRLQNRQMELKSEKYLLELAKKCDQYDKYIKKLAKHVHQERVHVEKGIHHAKYSTVKGINGKKSGSPLKPGQQASLQCLILYNELEIERMSDRQAELEDKLVQMTQNVNNLDSRLDELNKLYEQPIASSNKLKYKQIEHKLAVDQKNIKTFKANFKHKICILNSQIEELNKQNRTLTHQINDQQVSSLAILERLKRNIEDVSNQDILELANYLISKLEKSHLGNQSSQAHQLTHNSKSINKDQSFTTNIIRLKRRLAAFKDQRDGTLSHMYKIEPSNLITQLPSLHTTHSPSVTRHRTNSQGSLTTDEDQDHSRKLARFSYW